MIIPSHLSILLYKYGGVALMGLLALGIIGLPIPDETLLVFCGYLIVKGKISFLSTLLCAIIGSIVGISVSYLIGRTLGYSMLHRFGKYIFLDDKKLERGHIWFEKIGKWLLVFGYFIPGVRHVTGIIAGVTRLHYWKFAIFAYSGATFWATLYLCIGFLFSNQYQHFFNH